MRSAKFDRYLPPSGGRIQYIAYESPRTKGQQYDSQEARMNQLNAIVEKYIKKANSPNPMMPHSTRMYYLNAADNIREFISRTQGTYVE